MSYRPFEDFRQLLFSDHLACDGAALFAKVGELGSEGIVSTRVEAPYTTGR